MVGHTKHDAKTRITQLDFLASMEFCGVLVLKGRSYLVGPFLKTR